MNINDIFNDNLKSIGQRLQEQRRRLREAQAQQENNQSTEQIAEISKQALGSYVKKSAFDSASKAIGLGAETDAEKIKKKQDAVLKRQRGIARATDRLVRKEGVAEGLPQTLRKVVPGYAKREIDKKMDAEKFGRTDVDRDANFQRYKKIQDKIKEQGVAEGSEQQFMIYFVVPEYEDYTNRHEPTEQTIVVANSPKEAAIKFRAETPEAYIKDIVSLKSGVAEGYKDYKAPYNRGRDDIDNEWDGEADRREEEYEKAQQERKAKLAKYENDVRSLLANGDVKTAKKVAGLSPDAAHRNYLRNLIRRHENRQGVAEGLSPQQKRAHQANLDAAQRAMDRREAEGEDMTGATIDQKTYKIIKPKSSGVAEGHPTHNPRGFNNYIVVYSDENSKRKEAKVRARSPDHAWTSFENAHPNYRISSIKDDEQGVSDNDSLSESIKHRLTEMRKAGYDL